MSGVHWTMFDIFDDERNQLLFVEWIKLMVCYGSTGFSVALGKVKFKRKIHGCIFYPYKSICMIGGQYMSKISWSLQTEEKDGWVDIDNERENRRQRWVGGSFFRKCAFKRCITEALISTTTKKNYLHGKTAEIFIHCLSE